MIVFSSIVTILFALVSLFYNRKTKNYQAFLSAFLIIFSLYAIGHYFNLFDKNPFVTAIFWNNFSPLWMLCGPLIYFYVKGTLDDSIQWNKYQLLHLLPSLIIFIGLIPYLFTSFDYKLSIAHEILNDPNKIFEVKMNWILSNQAVHISRFATSLIYILISFNVLYKKVKSDQDHSRQFKLINRWLIILLSITFLISLLFTIGGIGATFIGIASAVNVYKIMHNIIGMLFLLLPVMLLLFPQILYGLPSRVSVKETLPSATASISIPNQLKNKNAEAFKELSENILKYFDEEKPFLDKNFNLTVLAASMNVPQHHISYCFSDFMDVSFTKLRANKRVAYAQELLQQGMTKEYTIEKVAELSGFSSRSNFFSTFKECAGMTPTEFVEQHKNN